MDTAAGDIGFYNAAIRAEEALNRISRFNPNRFSPRQPLGQALRNNQQRTYNGPRFKKLTDQERKEFAIKNICFSCRQQGHKSWECPNRQKNVNMRQIDTEEPDKTIESQEGTQKQTQTHITSNETDQVKDIYSAISKLRVDQYEKLINQLDDMNTQYEEPSTNISNLWINALIPVIPGSKSFHIPIKLGFKNTFVDVAALIDSGAEGLFINSQLVRGHKLKKHQLLQPITLLNVDGTENTTGLITHFILQPIQIGKNRSIH